MVSNIVTKTATGLVIEPTGVNKVLGFQGVMEIPFSHIKSASIDFGILNESGVWRTGGTSAFGKSVGTFTKKDLIAYVNLKGKEQPLRLELVGEGYQQMVLGVENPQALIDEISPEIAQNTSVQTPNPTPAIKRRRSPFRTFLNVVIALALIGVVLGIISSILQHSAPQLSHVLAIASTTTSIIMVIAIVIALLVNIKNSNK